MPDLGGQVRVSEGKVVDIDAEAEGAKLKVERVDGQVDAGKGDAGDIGRGRVAWV